MAKKKAKKIDQNYSEIKSSAANLLLNTLIFFLSALIIYLLYSLVLNLTGDDPIERQQEKSGAASDIIQVQVLNGCGVSGIADRFTEYLRQKKFDVVDVGNYTSFDIDETTVIDRIGNKANALKVAKVLGLKNYKNVIVQLNKKYLLDVSVIIGKDYDKLKPLNIGE